MPNDPFIIAGRAFRSRLMVGTGKFPSAAEIVTVALMGTGAKRAALSGRFSHHPPRPLGVGCALRTIFACVLAPWHLGVRHSF